MEKLNNTQQDLILDGYREDKCQVVAHKDTPEEAICDICYKPYNSEHHMSDECVNYNED